MTQEEPIGTVVWQRAVDAGRASQRSLTLKRWYGIPFLLILAVALVSGGPGAMLGVLILLGGIGLLLVLGVAVVNKGMAANPEIRLLDGRLILGRNEVRVADVESWTTAKINRTSDVPGPAAVAMFRLPIFDDGQRRVRPDGGPAYEVIDFGWPEMTVAEIDGVRRALENHITAPWVPLDRLRD